MKLIALVGGAAGSGAMTIAVNLCVAMAGEKKSVLGLGFGEHERLRRWLQPVHKKSIGDSAIEKNCFNFDTVLLPEQVTSDVLKQFLEQAETDYELIFSFGLPANTAAQSALLTVTDWLGLCVNLKRDNILAETLNMAACLEKLRERPPDLLIPNQVNPQEWENNAEILLALSEELGSERIAEMIPFCERIHDLPVTGGTVWELEQDNLRFPFNQLLCYLPLNEV